MEHAYDQLMPILYPSMISEFNLSYGLVGMLIMGYRLSNGALQLLMGFLGRFVRRKFLLGLGKIWVSIANSLIAISQGFEHIFASRTLAGVGSSPQHPTGSSYIAENFSKNQMGRALGINLVVSRIGNFLTPLVGSLLLASLGWRMTILAFSIPLAFVGIAFLFIAEPKGSSKWSGAASIRLLFKGMREVLSNRKVLVVIVVQTVMAFRIGASSFIPSYLQIQGMTSLEVGMVYAVFIAAGIPGPYFWGYMSDKFGRRKAVMFTMSMACILWYLLSYGGNQFTLLSILVPLGFVTAGVGGVIQAFVAEVTDPENRDLVYGVYFTLSFTIGSLSSVIVGYLADFSSFQTSFLYVALVSFFAAFAAYFLK